MKKSKLVALLSTFSSAEWRDLRDYVASPFFNKRPELVQMTAYLSALAPAFPDEKLQKQAVYAAIHPGEQLDEKQLGYYNNYLLGLAEDMLEYRRFEQANRQRQLLRLEVLADRGLEKHYLFTYRQAETEAATGIQDGDYWMFRRQLEHHANHYFLQQRVRRHDPHLQMAADALDRFYWIHKLRYTCEMLDRQRVMTTDYQMVFVEEVKRFLQSHPVDVPLLEMYGQIMLMLSAPAEIAHFEQYKTLFFANTETVSRQERGELLSYGINYCIRKTRQGLEAFTEATLDLYFQGIKEGLLQESGYLSHWTYANVVKLGLRLQRYEWTQWFIKQYNDSLQPDKQEDALYFNLADLYYHQGDFDQTQQLLQKVQLTDAHYHIGSRILLIKIYYDNGEMDPLLSLLASFGIFLRRHKEMAADLRKTCLNFCNILAKITRSTRDQTDQLLKTVQQTTLLTERAWLLEKVRQLGR